MLACDPDDDARLPGFRHVPAGAPVDPSKDRFLVGILRGQLGELSDPLVFEVVRQLGGALFYERIGDDCGRCRVFGKCQLVVRCDQLLAGLLIICEDASVAAVVGK